MNNPLRNRTNDGGVLLGIWSTIPSPKISEVFGLSGLDFQIFDLEHGVFDMKNLEENIRSCEATGCIPIVRVPGLLQHIVQSVMDFGAYGVIVPQIRTKSDVEKIVKYMKFPPDGVRGFNPFTRFAYYQNTSFKSVNKLEQDFGFISVIIENEEAYENIDEILLVPELDMVYLGVYDMSVSLGIPGQVNHPRIDEFLKESIKKIRASGKAAGMIINSKEDIKAAIELGANMLVFSVDTNIIYQATSNIVQELKSVSGNLKGVKNENQSG